MKTRAAVAWEAGKPLEIEMIDLEGPKAGEFCYETSPPVSATQMPLRSRATIRKASFRPYSVTRVAQPSRKSALK
jgi:hypothetical protein